MHYLKMIKKSIPRNAWSKKKTLFLPLYKVFSEIPLVYASQVFIDIYAGNIAQEAHKYS